MLSKLLLSLLKVILHFDLLIFRQCQSGPARAFISLWNRVAKGSLTISLLLI